MTNASFEPLLDPVTGEDFAPRHGDIVLALQPDGCCFMARHPGEWQISFGSHAEAAAVAARYATLNGARVWVQNADNDYEPIGGGTVGRAEVN